MERIKAYIEKVVDRLKKEDDLMEQFDKNPVKVLEKVLGVDLPDDVVNGVVAGVKAKLSADKLSDLAGAFKKLF